jgi:hypothetical protein
MTSQREVGTSVLSRSEHRAFMRLTREWRDAKDLRARKDTLEGLVHVGLAERWTRDGTVTRDNFYRIINVLEEKR